MTPGGDPPHRYMITWIILPQRHAEEKDRELNDDVERTAHSR
ncbi:hypothetical protein ABT168_31315 [Streptomyces sp. NPDC001793]